MTPVHDLFVAIPLDEFANEIGVVGLIGRLAGKI